MSAQRLPEPRWRRSVPGVNRAILLDMLTIVAALAAALVARGLPLDGLWAFAGLGPHPGLAAWNRNESALVLFQMFTIPTFLYALGQYRFVAEPAANWSFNRLLVATLGSFATLVLILFVLGIGDVARIIIGLDFLFIMAGLAGWRGAYQARIRARLEEGAGLRNALILGNSGLAQRVASYLAGNTTSGRRVVGFLAVDAEAPLDEVAAGDASATHIRTGPPALDVEAAVRENTKVQPRHILATLGELTEDNLSAALDGLNVEEVFVDPFASSKMLPAILNACQQRAIDVQLIPEHHTELGIQPRPWHSGGFVFLDVHSLPISRLGAAVKRLLDILIASAAMLVAAPLILVCALAVKLENPGSSSFYGGTRIGLKGHHFRQWKFSTMRPDADRFRDELRARNARDGPWFQLEEEDDPRITRVGRFLRKYSLNDLPQFWNVLRGDMSIVGPRPLAVDEVAQFIDFDVKYYRIFDVKPGITGLWQISNRMNPSFEYRVQKDFQYIRSWNIGLDVRIMLVTPWAMLRGGR